MKTYKLWLVLAAGLFGTAAYGGETTVHPRPTQVAQTHDHHAAAAANGKGVINSVDFASHKVNVSHEPIPSLGWPAMKMDFAVAPSVDLKAVQPGTQVEFTVGKNKEGLPEIQAIQAVEK